MSWVLLAVTEFWSIKAEGEEVWHQTHSPCSYAVPHGKQRAPVFLLLSSLHCLDTLKQGRVAESSLQGVLVSMPGARTALALTSTASTSQRPGCMWVGCRGRWTNEGLSHHYRHPPTATSDRKADQGTVRTICLRSIKSLFTSCLSWPKSQNMYFQESLFSIYFWDTCFLLLWLLIFNYVRLKVLSQLRTQANFSSTVSLCKNDYHNLIYIFCYF